jgi:hypothetical protein
MANREQGIGGAYFSVGDYVLVRCLVTAITPALAGTGTPGGAGDSVSLTVETPGNAGEQKNVTLVVSPVQCRKAGDPNQA